MNIKEELGRLLKDQTTTKVLTTVASEGIPHTIHVGSISKYDEHRLVAFEIFMTKTRRNLESTKKATILLVNGKDSYELVVNPVEHITSGVELEQASKSFREMGLPIKGMWLFTVQSVTNQGANPDAGQEIKLQ